MCADESVQEQYCQCIGCDCGNIATTTDDGGTPVCSECVKFAVTADGDVVCANAPLCKQCGENVLDYNPVNYSYFIRPCACVRRQQHDEEVHDSSGRYGVKNTSTGCILSRHASLEGAEKAIKHESERFHMQYPWNTTSYLPREIVEIDDE